MMKIAHHFSFTFLICLLLFGCGDKTVGIEGKIIEKKIEDDVSDINNSQNLDDFLEVGRKIGFKIEEFDIEVKRNNGYDLKTTELSIMFTNNSENKIENLMFEISLEKGKL